jgi:polyphenol oxidase
MPFDWIVPDWPAPKHVGALITTRNGGSSRGVFASLNLGDHVGDAPAAVASNRAVLRSYLPADPLWLQQIHSNRVIEALASGAHADSSMTRTPHVVCAVLSADCLPVLLCDTQSTAVAVVHAGWRGLAAGVLENTVAALQVPAKRLLAYLGPAIGVKNYQVGEEVRRAFLAHERKAGEAFFPDEDGKWRADLPALARHRLAALGVERIWGGHDCTAADPARFFSYRRDGPTGRMASLIWLK